MHILSWGLSNVADDLAELHERAQYCREGIATLKGDIVTWAAASISYRTRPSIVVDLRELHLFATLLAPVPIRLRINAGMIANELRSCLDALACQLAIRNGKTTAGVYFPISKSEEIFEDDGRQKIKKLAQQDQATIANLKPWGGGNLFLSLLHEADRIRKHIKLIASGAGGGMMVGNVVTQPGQQIVFERCWIGGFYVRRMRCLPDTAFSEVGEEVAVAEYIPNGLALRPVPELYYAEPGPLMNCPVLSMLGNACEEVDKIIRLFD